MAKKTQTAQEQLLSVRTTNRTLRKKIAILEEDVAHQQNRIKALATADVELNKQIVALREENKGLKTINEHQKLKLNITERNRAQEETQYKNRIREVAAERDQHQKKHLDDQQLVDHLDQLILQAISQ